MREFSDDKDPQEPEAAGSPRFGLLLLVLLAAVLLVAVITFASEAWFS